MDGSNLPLVEARRIGRVIAVSAAQVFVLLEIRTADPLRPSEPLEMGALVKLQTRASTVYGMVSALRVPLPSLSAPDQDLKIVEIELLGEMLRDANGVDRGFQRGVSVFPSIESLGLPRDRRGPRAGLCAARHRQRAGRHDLPGGAACPPTCASTI